jgi:hypothetical protein
MVNIAGMCVFFYPRAKKIYKCVRENQYNGNVAFLYIFLLYSDTYLITSILFILQVIMHPVLYFLIGTCVCGGRSSVHVSDRA